MFQFLVCFDDYCTIPKEKKCRSKYNTKDTIKDIDGVFKNTLNRDVLNGKYIIEKESKLWIEKNKRTEENIKCHQYKYGSFQIFPS
jgi:hypothetical protein